MFTGLIRDIGTVTARRDMDAGARLTIATALPGLALGDSVACAGVCLTVVEAGGGSFTVEASPETLACTHIGSWAPGTRANLEPALRVGDALGGHFVTGHVDGLARLLSIEEAGDFWRLSVEAPAALAPLIAPKGSVALDGISLTVNGTCPPVPPPSPAGGNDGTNLPPLEQGGVRGGSGVGGGSFDVMIIPHTWAHTTLHLAQPGDRLHIEADMLARYAARILETRP
jgi:riboflavin synthase